MKLTTDTIINNVQRTTEGAATEPAAGMGDSPVSPAAEGCAAVEQGMATLQQAEDRLVREFQDASVYTSFGLCRFRDGRRGDGYSATLLFLDGPDECRVFTGLGTSPRDAGERAASKAREARTENHERTAS
jgi:hypothetical protein